MSHKSTLCDEPYEDIGLKRVVYNTAKDLNRISSKVHDDKWNDKVDYIYDSCLTAAQLGEFEHELVYPTPSEEDIELIKYLDRKFTKKGYQVTLDWNAKTGEEHPCAAATIKIAWRD